MIIITLFTSASYPVLVDVHFETDHRFFLNALNYPPLLYQQNQTPQQRRGTKPGASFLPVQPKLNLVIFNPFASLMKNEYMQ